MKQHLLLSFPRNETRRNRWLQALNLKDCTDWHRVCSDHFSPSDFRPGEKRLLWPFALPKPGLVKLFVLQRE